MFHKRSDVGFKWGRSIGYIFGFFLFSSILYFILTFTGKLTAGLMSYGMILAGAVGLQLIGLGLSKVLR